MTRSLTADDFPAFFQEVHGYLPFPWQIRLLRQIVEEGRWPEVLDLPTGSGKTAALDIAVFHLALEVHRRCARRAPVRIAFVVDRRLVVDDAFERAKKIENALADGECGQVTSRVAENLRQLGGSDAPPLAARRLRGGIPREDSWVRTPSQPTILCSTVDQVGSRLLFRGYGVSDRMKPVHAGLMGADCLLLLDEAHLSEPFRQTLQYVERYKNKAWREGPGSTAPWGVALLTATPGSRLVDTFSLGEDDRKNEILARRLDAPKPARLIDMSEYDDVLISEISDEEREGEADQKTEDKRIVPALVKEALRGLRALKKNQGNHGQPALAVVVNRVARARSVFEELTRHPDTAEADRILLIGPSRPVDKDLLAAKLRSIYTGIPRTLIKPLVIVATQCIEAGVDIDLDGLITEAAPIDALRQRFGRLNRNGRRELEPYAAIIGGKARSEDPVYGKGTSEAWKYLNGRPDEPRNGKEKAKVDFGLAAFEKRIAECPIPSEAISSKPDAPVLLPAHVDLLNQTAPVPAADLDVSLYLHGPERAPDSVSIIWRADLDSEFPERVDARRLLLLMPPRAAEAIELPVWAVRNWLTGQGASLSALADIPTLGSDEDTSRRKQKRQMVFRWAGDDDRSIWVNPARIRPGDTVIIPARYGGVDEFGWNPNRDNSTPAEDIADRAAAPFEGRRFAVRVAPGLLGKDGDEEALANVIAANENGRWRELKDALISVLSSGTLVETLNKLDRARGKVQTYSDCYGQDENGPRGVIFLAPLGLRDTKQGMRDSPDTTEDDTAGSLPGFALPLQQHSRDVEAMAKRLAELAGLSEDRVIDLEVAGWLHDTGKIDKRFQQWLAYGDPLGPDPNCPEDTLAKSQRQLPRDARTRSGLPKNWRHEALSVRIAPFTPRFADAKDPELVLWLIGTHHGHGRPLFPHADQTDQEEHGGLSNVLGIPSTLAPRHGPQSLAYDWNGMDWPSVCECLKTRYGVWELARMEAILRLADHRASEQSGREACEKDVKNQ